MEINWDALLAEVQRIPATLENHNNILEIAIVYERPTDDRRINFVLDKTDHTFTVASFQLIDGENIDEDSLIKIELSMKEARLLYKLLSRPDAKAAELQEKLTGLRFVKAGPVRQTRGLGFLAWEVRAAGEVTVASGFDVAEIVDDRIVRLWTVLNNGE